MLLLRRMRAGAFLTVGLLLLSACAETQFLFHTAKQVQLGGTRCLSGPMQKRPFPRITFWWALGAGFLV